MTREHEVSDRHHAADGDCRQAQAQFFDWLHLVRDAGDDE
jgi:hypothetical protein